MTVKELREALSQYPDAREVYVMNDRTADKEVILKTVWGITELWAHIEHWPYDDAIITCHGEDYGAMLYLTVKD